MNSSQKDRRGGDTVEIYAIRGGDAVKIGVARDVEARRATMQTGNPPPRPLVVIARAHVEREAAYRIEHIAHGYLREARIGGEWFRATDAQARAAILHGVDVFDRAEAGNNGPPNEWDAKLKDASARFEDPRSPRETYLEWLARVDARRERNVARRQVAKRSRERAPSVHSPSSSGIDSA